MYPIISLSYVWVTRFPTSSSRHAQSAEAGGHRRHHGGVAMLAGVSGNDFHASQFHAAGIVASVVGSFGAVFLKLGAVRLTG